jgi:small-conductance mechanosensitive channel
MADAAAVGVSTIAIGQSVVAYQFLMPKLSEVRRADPADELMQGDVFWGQIGAAALAVAVGLMLTSLTGSRIPLYTSMFIAALLAVVYHFAWRSQP